MNSLLIILSLLLLPKTQIQGLTDNNYRVRRLTEDIIVAFDVRTVTGGEIYFHTETYPYYVRVYDNTHLNYIIRWIGFRQNNEKKQKE